MSNSFRIKSIILLTCPIVLVYLLISGNCISEKTRPESIRTESTSSKREFRVEERHTLSYSTEMIDFLIKLNFKTMIEVGVRDGEYAYKVLEKWKEFDHYYGIDPYEKQVNYFDWANKEQAVQDNDYSRVLNTLNSRFGKDKVSLIRNYSTNVVGLFKKESIDFIYIDARHDYCGVTEDMEAYFPILKCGGLFAGHDYGYNEASHNQDWDICANGTKIAGSVKRAVLEFAERHTIPLIQIAERGSWFFFKKC
jgi:hypothetical protein